MIGGAAAAVAKPIITKLGELAVKETILQWGFKDDMEDMEEKMKDLQAVLNDVDTQSRYGDQGGEAAERWATKFKSVAYDTEDVLDKLEANELIKSQPTSKLKLFLSCNNPLLQRIIMPHKLKNLRKKIDDIANEKPKLHPRPQEAQTEGRRNDETFASITDGKSEIGMIGRDKEKEAIVSLVLNFEAAEDISIVPIIGMGGVGKSTLAQAVYEDTRAKIFDIRAWASLSNKFDVLDIGKAIVQGVNSSSNNSSTACSNLQAVHDSLKEKLNNKRYLIVLDNLWEEDGNKLDKLKEMLRAGCKGSKIIVTTRHSRVVQQLGTGAFAEKICPVPEPQQIKLDGLSPDDCWKVMKRRAFGPHDEPSSLLEEIGKQIAKKCRGLPLVANALGQVMSEQKTTQAWEEIRDRKIVLDLKESHEKASLESLMLSYYYMKLSFKHCFTYLAAFPKGFIMDTNHVTEQWIALGCIERRVSGQSCINYLLGMSFLQTSESSSSIIPVHPGTPQKVTMHDLVHDLVTIIAASESLVLDASAEPDAWKAAKAAKHYCRHAQVTNYLKQSSVLDVLPTKLRSLHFRNRTEVLLPRKAFSRSKYLRVLDLSGHTFKQQPCPSNKVLPASIHNLILLKYVNVSGLPIVTLTKSFHQLQNIQTLIISNCSLESLPSNIGSLRKLCYLDISANSTLSKLPASLGDLLELFFLNVSGCSKLHGLPKSLGKLASLSYLDMSECPALERLPESLGSLTKLSYLNLSSCFQLTELPANLKLESLQHLNLSDCHNLENLPQGLGHLQKLEFLSLSGCHKVQLLPDSICQLKHLKNLDLSDCHNLKELPLDFGNMSKLDTLDLTSCPMLITLPESICNISRLKHLNLSYCVGLRNLPSSFSNLNIQILELSGCYLLRCLPDGIDNMTCFTRLVMHSGKPVVLKRVAEIQASHNMLSSTLIYTDKLPKFQDVWQLSRQNLCFLKLDGKLRDNSKILDLRLLWDGEGYSNVTSEDLVPPCTLLSFVLRGYKSKDFPYWMLDISSYLPNLTHIALANLMACESLPPLGQLPNLRIVILRNIPKLKKIGTEFYGCEGTSKKLRGIMLELLENLEEWWVTRPGDEDEEFLIPNLHRLQVVDCPKLKFLPHPPRSTIIWWLDNSAEVLPRSEFERLSASTLPLSVTIKNCDLTLDHWDRLQNLTTLDHLQVINCGSLRSLREVILRLASLRRIIIKSCKDLDEVPEYIGQLVQLEVLVIQDCSEVKILPDGIESLPSLKILCLQDCRGLDALPEWLGQVTSLEEIVLRGIPNLKSLPDSVKNLPSLRTLLLCSLQDDLPEWIGQLTSLEKFALCHIPGMKSLPDRMNNLKSLRALGLDCCGGLDVLPEWLGQLTSLEEILLWNISNLKSLPESMKNMNSLKKLVLGGCHVALTDSLQVIGHLASLEQIHLAIPSLTFLPESMKSLTALEALYLEECNIEVLPGWISKLTSLKELYILQCHSMTCLPESIRNLHSLKKLYIWRCPRLVESCQGDDADKISHIPIVTFASDHHRAPFIPFAAIFSSVFTMHAEHACRAHDHQMQQESYWASHSLDQA